MGAKGLLSGAESVIADLQVELFQKGDSLNDPISLVVHALYGPPHSARSMPAVGEARRLYTLRK